MSLVMFVVLYLALIVPLANCLFSGRVANIPKREKEADWVELAGTASEISAKGQHVWALSEDKKNISKWIDGAWSFVASIPVQLPFSPYSVIAAGQDGSLWLTDRTTTFRYFNGKWTNRKVQPVVAIGALTIDEAFACATTLKTLYKWKGFKWSEEMPQPNCNSLIDSVAFGEDNSKSLTCGGELHRLNRNSWEEIKTKFTFGTVSQQNETRIVASTKIEEYSPCAFYNGIEWIELPPLPTDEATLFPTISNDAIFCVGKGTKKIFKFDV